MPKSRGSVINFHRARSGVNYSVFLLQQRDPDDSVLAGVGDSFYVRKRGGAFVHIGACDDVSVAVAQSAWRGGVAMYGPLDWQRRAECIGISLATKAKALWPIGPKDVCQFSMDGVVRRMYARAMAWESYERQTAIRGFAPLFGELPNHDFVAQGAIFCPLRTGRLCHASADGLVCTVRFPTPDALANVQWWRHRDADVVRPKTGGVYKIAFVGSIHVVLVLARVCQSVVAKEFVRRVDLEAAAVVYPYLAAPDMELELAVYDPFCDRSLMSLREAVLALWRVTLEAPSVGCGVCFAAEGGAATGCCGQGLCAACDMEWRKQANGNSCPFCREVSL